MFGGYKRVKKFLREVLDLVLVRLRALAFGRSLPNGSKKALPNVK